MVNGHRFKGALLGVLFALAAAAPGLSERASADANETAVSGTGALVHASITAGAGHTCVLTEGGAVKCWGRNNNGQLGNGSNTDSNTPVDVSALPPVVTAITTGSLHTCALLATGGVKCWGNNSSGQLGDNSVTNSNVPVSVATLSSGVTAISAGFYHTCALLGTGAVKCWGYNNDGQLGDSSWTDQPVPIDVATLSSGVTSISASNGHTCALLSGGGIKCWGLNDWGELGDNSGSAQPSPVDVVPLGGSATALSTGGFHTCARLADGSAKCWGRNVLGQLGDNSNTDRPTPVQVSSLAGAVSISAGVNHSCALLSGGGAKCWGSNGDGQLGDNSNTDTKVPVDVSGLTTGVAAITTGHFHSCALLSSGGVKCWGSNFRGQLGDGTNTDRVTAANVSGLGTGVGLTTTTTTTSTTTTTTASATTTTQPPTVASQSATTTTPATSVPARTSTSGKGGTLPFSGKSPIRAALIAAGLVVCGTAIVSRRRVPSRRARPGRK